MAIRRRWPGLNNSPGARIRHLSARIRHLSDLWMSTLLSPGARRASRLYLRAPNRCLVTQTAGHGSSSTSNTSAVPIASALAARAWIRAGS